MQAGVTVQRVERRDRQLHVAGSKFEAVRRLLIARHDRLGDFILTIPAIVALRRTYPDAELAVLVAPGVAPLAGLVAGIDQVLETNSRRSLLDERISRFAPDLIVCVSSGEVVPWSAWRARVKYRIGPGRRFYSPLFTHRINGGAWKSKHHEVELALSFAQRAGAMPGPAHFPIVVPESAHQRAGEWLEGHAVGSPFVVLHPGNGGSCPGWPVEHFMRLAREFAEAGIQVVFTLGPLENQIALSVQELCGEKARIACFADELPVLAALLDRAALVVSSSTGPIHLAAALGTPTLALHVPWATCSVSRWGPYAANGWALIADHPGALSWSRAERRRRGPDLLAEIVPRTVLGCALDLLAGRDPLAST